MRMSPMLQREVTCEVYVSWMEDVLWITPMSKPCLVALIQRMENFLYVPKEKIPDERQTCFVQRGRILYGGRHLVKGDSFGTDMTLDGPMRQHLSGYSINFGSTLSINYHDLHSVLMDYDS